MAAPGAATCPRGGTVRAHSRAPRSRPEFAVAAEHRRGLSARRLLINALAEIAGGSQGPRNHSHPPDQEILRESRTARSSRRTILGTHRRMSSRESPSPRSTACLSPARNEGR